MVRFAALDEAAVREELIRRGIAPNVAKDAAALARGSLGTALKWIEDDVIGPARNLIAMIDALFAGRAPEDLPGWFKTAAEAYAAKQLERDELSSKDQATREGLTLYPLLAGEHIRRKMAQSGHEAEVESACSAIDALVQAETFLDSTVNISLIFQQLAVKLEAVGLRHWRQLVKFSARDSSAFRCTKKESGDVGILMYLRALNPRGSRRRGDRRLRE